MKTKLIQLTVLLSFALGACYQGLGDADTGAADPSISEGRAIAGFPDYRFLKVVEPANPLYDPTGEFIFPAVVRVADHVANPLGSYYLYYAPHDAPGGICLAYSDNIEGPYTAYSDKPVISNTFGGKNVTHVSGPYVLWMPEYGKYIMYYHGENSTNRWAYSTDGISWSYGGVCNSASQFGSGYTECQYAKVYRHTIPGQGNTYIMLHMLLSGTGSGRKIALSLSNDGKTFTPYDANLILPAADGCVDLSGPALLVRDGRYYVVYHGSTGNMYLTEVGPSFTMENHLGVFYDSMGSAPENGRAASPYLMTVGNVNYMFYESGQRGSTTISLAREIPASPVFEAEALPTAASGAVQEDISDSRFSGGAANKLEADGAGDYAEYTVYVPAPGVWNIEVGVKKQNARGIMQLYLPQANRNVGSAKDLYSATDSYATISLGSYDFASPGDKLFRFIVTGKNAASGGYSLVLDTVKLSR